jgi:uncharacterized membrane protein
MQLLAVLLLTQVAALRAFAPRAIRPSAPRSTLKMIEIEANTATYVGMFLATIVPSLILGELPLPCTYQLNLPSFLT